MRKKKGFTLPELMVVVLIMAVLMAVATPMWLGARARANARACQANLQIINSAIKEWALDEPGTAVANYSITVGDIDPYIDGEFASLEEPTTQSAIDYVTDNGNGVLDNLDVVGTISGAGALPTPTCRTGLANHAI